MKNSQHAIQVQAQEKGVATVLSPLEAYVCKVLWSHCKEGKKMRVREIHSKLKGNGAALTSVAVILDRLHKKGLVGRESGTGRGGVYYLYFPRGSREQAERSLIDGAVNRLIDSFGPSAVSYFNERFAGKQVR